MLLSSFLVPAGWAVPASTAGSSVTPARTSQPLAAAAEVGSADVPLQGLLGSSVLTTGSSESQAPVEKWELFQRGGRLVLAFRLPQGGHLYEDMLGLEVVSPAGVRLVRSGWPEPAVDPATGRRYFEGDVEFQFRVVVPRSLAGAGDRLKLRLLLSYQVCLGGMCALPQKLETDFSLAVEPSMLAAEAASEAPDSSESSSRGDAAAGAAGVLWYYLAGVALSLTPCVYPMIPVTVSIIGAGSSGTLSGFLRSMVYVSGIGLTYATLGVVAALSGSTVGAAMQNPWVLLFVALLFFVLGLSMLDLFYIPVPSFLGGGAAAGGGRSRGLLGVFLLGMVSGLVMSPCVTPVLAGLLIQIAAEGDVAMGFVRLFVFAVGMGSLLIVAGTFSGSLGALPRAGEWMNEVKKVFAVLLMGAAVYFLTGVPWFGSRLLLWGAFLVVLAVCGWKRVDDEEFAPGWSFYYRVRNGVMALALIAGAACFHQGMREIGLLPAAPLGGGGHGEVAGDASSLQWRPYSDEAIELARREDTPVLIDFSAEWCAACRELEEKTFSDPAVRKEMRRFLLLRMDMTNPSPEHREIASYYGVVGFPTVLFLDSRGRLVKDCRVVGFMEPARFLEVLRRVR